jgi:predicted deacylase
VTEPVPRGQTYHLRAQQFFGLRPGPRLIVLAAVHGNEVCGMHAIERVARDLTEGALRIERGTLTMVPVTNPLAHALGQRAGERNLNRNLRPAAAPQDFEDRIANVLCPLLDAHDALLDLHSFLSPGQPFALVGPRDNDGALEPFARSAEESALAAHVGPTRIVEGWLDAYERGVRRRRQRPGSAERQHLLNNDPNYGVGTTEYMRSRGGYAVTVECGQHDDPAAPQVAHRAIMQALALLRLAPVELEPPAPRHEVIRLVDVTDRLHPDDSFVRTWSSFDPVRAGETIGRRHDGTLVAAPADGRIVFPNAKAEAGQEWFYFAQPSARSLLD